jgi:hypothetical protein
MKLFPRACKKWVEKEYPRPNKRFRCAFAKTKQGSYVFSAAYRSSESRVYREYFCFDSSGLFYDYYRFVLPTTKREDELVESISIWDPTIRLRKFPQGSLSQFSGQLRA